MLERTGHTASLGFNYSARSAGLQPSLVLRVLGERNSGDVSMPAQTRTSRLGLGQNMRQFHPELPAILHSIVAHCCVYVSWSTPCRGQAAPQLLQEVSAQVPLQEGLQKGVLSLSLSLPEVQHFIRRLQGDILQSRRSSCDTSGHTHLLHWALVRCGAGELGDVKDQRLHRIQVLRILATYASCHVRPATMQSRRVPQQL